MIMQNSIKLGRKEHCRMSHQIILLHYLFLKEIVWNSSYGMHSQSPMFFHKDWFFQREIVKTLQLNRYSVHKYL